MNSCKDLGGHINIKTTRRITRVETGEMVITGLAEPMTMISDIYKTTPIPKHEKFKR